MGSRTIWLLLLALSLGCGQATDLNITVDRDFSTTGIRASICTDELLRPPSGEKAGTCTGPWRYITYDCFQSRADLEVCGPSGAYERKFVGPQWCESNAFPSPGMRRGLDIVHDEETIRGDFLKRGASGTWPKHDDTAWFTGFRHCQATAGSYAPPAGWAICADVAHKRTWLDRDLYASYAMKWQTFTPMPGTGFSTEACGTKVCSPDVPEALRCRRQEFGIAGYWHQNEGHPASPRFRVTRPRAREDIREPFGEAYAQCREWAAQTARSNLPDQSYGVCRSPRLGNFAHSSRENYWEVDFDVDFYAPVYNERQDARACGAAACVGQWVDDTSRPIPLTCRDVAFGREPTNVCGSPESIHYEGAGAPRGALDVQHAWAWSGDIATAECTTADADSSERFSAMFDRLHLSLARVRTEQHSAPAGLADDIAARMKLLFELHGLDLSVGQRDAAVALYREFAEADLCGAPDSAPSGNNSLCERLSMAHVPRALTAIYIAQCAGPDGAPDGRHQEAAVHAMVRHALGVTDDASIADDSEVEAGLEAIRDWYAIAEPTLRDEPSKLWAKTGTLLGALYKRVYGTPSASGERRGDRLLEDSSKAAAGLVARAMSLGRVGKPLHGAPLLYLLADSLQSLDARLDDLATFRDTACKFGRCGSSPADGGAVYEVHRCLAVLGDDASECRARRLPRPWDTAFEAMVSGNDLIHGSLESASPVAFREVDGVAASPQAAFHALRDRSRLRMSNFNGQGFYYGADAKVLHAGVQEGMRNLLVAEVKERRERLATALGDFERTRASAATEIFHEVAHGSAAALMARNVGEAAVALDHAVSGYEAAQATLSMTEQRAAESESLLGDLSTSAWARQHLVVASGPHRFSVPSDAGRYVTGHSDAPVDGSAFVLDAVPWKLRVDAGDLLQVHVGESRWSPTCALREAALDAPDGTGPVQVDVAHATAGPEGFNIVWSNNGYRVRAVETASERGHSEATTTSHIDCKTLSAAVNLGLNFFGTGISPSTGSSSATSCTGTSVADTTSSRDTSSDRAANDTQLSAVFSQGLRLSNTPFPNYPAGSLLLVETDPGLTSQGSIQRIRVIGSNTSLVMPADADVYLVVNDLHDDDCTESPGGLDVAVDHLRPQSAIVPRFGQALGSAAARMDQISSQVVLKGFVSAQEIASYREAIRRDVRAQCSGQFDFNDPLGGMFNAWVENQLALLDLQAHVVRMGREVHSERLHFQSLVDGLNRAGNESRLLHLLPIWSLANLDASLIRQGAHDVLNYLNRHVHPVLALRYPGAFELLSTDAEFKRIVSQIASPELSDAIADTGDSSLARLTLRMTDRILVALADSQPIARASMPLESLRTVAVTFDRDGSRGDLYWRRADAMRSVRAWAAFEARGRADLPVYLEDIYKQAMGPASLGCHVAAPIVRAMALFIEADETLADWINNGEMSASASVGDISVFPSGAGPEQYALDHAEWRTIQVPVIAGELPIALLRYKNVARTFQAANGLSPFTTFRIDLRGTGGHLDEELLRGARSITLIFSVDGRMLMSGESLAWIETCAGLR